MPSEAILLAVLALALLVLLILRLHVVYVWYRIHWANRRVLEDRREQQWEYRGKGIYNLRKADRRVKK